VTQPREIELTEVEALRLEVTQLKAMGAAAKAKSLSDAHAEVIEDVEKRLGIESLGAYNIDSKTLKGVLVAKGVENGRAKTGS